MVSLYLCISANGVCEFSLLILVREYCQMICIWRLELYRVVVSSLLYSCCSLRSLKACIMRSGHPLEIIVACMLVSLVTSLLVLPIKYPGFPVLGFIILLPPLVFPPTTKTWLIHCCSKHDLALPKAHVPGSCPYLFSSLLHLYLIAPTGDFEVVWFYHFCCSCLL